MTSSDQLAVLAVTQRNRLESFLMEFESTWNPERLNDYCGRLDSEKSQVYRQLAISELVKIDLQRRWSSGQGQMLEDYFHQIPNLGTPESVDADLILAEFAARRSVDGLLKLESYASRFPNQFDRLAQLVDAILDSNLTAQLPGSPVVDSPAQASIETSRVADIRDTAAPVQEPQKGIPQEFGRYRILRELGSGAMGVVYLAHDTQLDRQVALKTPSFGGGADQQLVTRFYREARAAAKIQHRNICPVYDVGEIEGKHFISMAFVNGRCMSEYITPDKLPPQKTSAILVHRIATALAEAHEHNVVHRDLKPANIIIDLNREPVVMDFGLARQTDVESRMTQTGMIVGTPAYMSPEQLKGKTEDLGPSVDIYSLGVILYELLTGKLPFRGAIAQVIYQIVNEEPTPPSGIRPDVDPDLEKLCAKMMAKRHNDRYQTMDEVANALKDYVKGVKPSASVDSGAEQQVETGMERSSDPATPPDKPKRDSEGFSETGALNAFFAAQSDANPQQTSIDLFPAGQSYPVARRLPPRESKENKVHRGGTGRLADRSIPSEGDRATTTEPIPRSQSRPPKKSKLALGFAGRFTGSRKWAAIGLGGAAALVLLAMGILLIRTPYGTIRIETFGDLKGLEVAVDGDTISLTESEKTRATDHEFALKLNGAELKLDPTTNEFVITQNGNEHRLSVTIGDIQLSSQQFTVARNQETVLKIELLPNHSEFAGKTEPPDLSPDIPKMNDRSAREIVDSNAIPRIGGDAIASKSTANVSLKLAHIFERVAGEYKQNNALAISRDGRWLVHSITSDRSLERLDLWSNKIVPLPFDSPVKVISAAFSEDASQLAVGTLDRRVIIYDLAGGTAPVHLQPTNPCVRQVAFAGEFVVSWSLLGRKSKLPFFERWNRQTWEPAGSVGAESTIFRVFWNVAISADGKRAGVPAGDSLKIWNLDTGEPMPVVFGNMAKKATMGVAISSDGQRVLNFGYDALAHIWDAKSGKQLVRSYGNQFKKTTLTRALFSPDGQWIIAARSHGATGASQPGRLVLRDSHSVEILAESEIPNRPVSGNSKYAPVWIKDLVTSNDGRTIVTAGQGTPICVWKVEENLSVGVGSTNTTEANAATTDNADFEGDLDRRAAKRIFERGGEVGLGTATSPLKVGGTPANPFKSLAKLPAGPLSIVDVSFFRVRGPVDPDLPLIAHMSNLRRIDLDRTQTTDAGVAWLKDLKNLEILWLRGTRVTDAGLANVTGLSNLTFLSLDNTSIGNEGLKHLVGLENLNRLSLMGTQVTDQGLIHLQTLTKLRSLNLKSTSVTEEEVNRLQAKLPLCKIGRDSTGSASSDNKRTNTAEAEMDAAAKTTVPTAPEQMKLVFEEDSANANDYDKRRNYAVTFSPTGEIIDTANESGTLRIRNVGTGEVVLSPNDRPGIEAVAWSADRSHMALGLRGSRIEVWKTGESQPVHSFQMSGSPSIRRVAFSSDGSKIIACGVRGTGKRRLVESWSLTEGSSLGKIDIESNDRLVNQRVFGLDISPDRSMVAIASGHGVQVWSLENHQLLQTIVTENTANFRAVVQTVVFSKDGKRLGLGSYGNLSVVDVATGKVIHRIVVGGKIHAVAFSPDGQSLVSYSLFKAKTNKNGVAKLEERQRFNVWDLATGKQIREWYYPGWGIARHLFFSPNGRYLVAAGHSFPLKVLEWE